MGLFNFNFRRGDALFGLDIGQTSLKVMQLSQSSTKNPKVIGYGISPLYPAKAIKNGEIVDPKQIAKALNELLQDGLTGSITTAHVACTLPTAHTFSRLMKLPSMNKDHLEEAIELEAEQYIPLPPDKLYIDYEIVGQDQENTELLVVAAPKTLVDSYMNFLNTVGLQAAALEPTMNASARLYRLVDPAHNQPTILVDFGSVATDIAVFDKTMFVNSTIEGGSDTITNLLAKKMGISSQEAYAIKNHDGLQPGERAPQIIPVVKPMLDSLVREVKRIIRYYDDRTGHNRRIIQLITTGGGATLKGLNEYLSAELKMPARMLNPWQQLDFGDLVPPLEQARSMYLTVAGEAIINAEELHS